MRKNFPLLFLIFSFSLFLFAQILFESTDLGAKEEQANEKMNKKYEESYQKLSFKFGETQPPVSAAEITQPIVILNFWASWCLPCIKEFKGLNALIDELGAKNILIVGVNNDYDEQNKKMEIAKEKYQLKFDSIPDKDGQYTSLFGVENIPFSFVFHKGKLVKISEGEFNFSNHQFVQSLKDLLN